MKLEQKKIINFLAFSINIFIFCLNAVLQVSLNQKQLKSPEEMTDYEMRATMKKLRLNRVSEFLILTKINQLYRKYDSMMYATGMTAEFFGPKEAGDLLMESVEMKEKEGKQRAQNSVNILSLLTDRGEYFKH